MGNWTPSIVPAGEDQSVYLVVDDFGHHGRCWRETDIDATDLETVITDLLDGQYNSPCGSWVSTRRKGGLGISPRILPMKSGGAAISR
jgi:hypothetical protein